MMKNTNIRLTLLLLITSLCSFGQSDSNTTDFNPETFKHKFGAAAGITTGVGFSYQYKPNRVGLMITTIPIKDEYQDVFVSAGLTLRYDVAQTKRSNIFLYQGNHFIHESNESSIYSYELGEYVTTREMDQQFNTGLGIGLELFLGNRFTSNFMLGYAARNNFTVFKPTIETGVYFRF